MPKGQQMPAVGAQRAPLISLLRFGSFSRTLSPSQISRPGTPLAWPRSRSSCRTLISSSSTAATKEPVHSISKSSSSFSSWYMALPSTFMRAFMLPVGASKPAWRIALLAFVVPAASSGSCSTKTARRLYFANSYSMAAPVIPPPMTTTSACFVMFTTSFFAESNTIVFT